MEDRIFSKSVFITDSEKEFILNYYILCNSSGGFKTYGVGIEKQNSNAVITESQSVSEIFTAERKARLVLDKLCREAVMPNELSDALEDLFNRDMQTLHPENKVS